jgi:hypothetical protein
MLASVNLDDQSCFNTNEVANVRRDRVLAPKLEAAELAISQEMPQPPFGVSLSAAQFSCSAFHFPSPYPSPKRRGD